MADIQAVLSALDALNRPADKTSFDRANLWLQDFQHSTEAWATCNLLLLSQDSPPLAKVFAAQTFRSKVTYDLHQLDASHVPSLRDTIVSALEQCSNGPKTIIVQLCLSLAGLALQYPGWRTPVQDMIDRFGQNPVLVPTLLEFLTVLPEEVNGNSKIPISNEEYKERAALLLTSNSKTIVELLSVYINATGVTEKVQSQILLCLRSWVVAGEIAISDLAETPLFACSFDSLESNALFDAAVDVVCDIIHETQEIEENMPIIKLIVDRLVQLRPKITASQGDSDAMRGYARVYSEAGETYRLLILQHPETFFPIVEAIGECSACSDLDVVPITFQFWMRLAQSIGKRPSVSPLFIEAYKTLMAVMIRHLHFPEDLSSWTAQEADDFRSFRHIMGDTLKDCCIVLGMEHCLTTVYELLTSALTKGSVSGAKPAPWQEIEAPLFSLRSMGAEIDPTDDRIIPKIMDLMPSLPDHPRVRYAAILVMSRYSEWTNRHPSYIPFQLQFISSGFESADTEVAAAASQAMNYLCLDCKRHMVSYLPQLHSFLTSMGGNMLQEDRRRIYEAVGHVITAMPMEQAAQSLKTFSVEILAKIHAVVTRSNAPSKQEMQDVSDGLENLEAMLSIVQSFGDELPASCRSSCGEAWAVFDPFLVRFGDKYDIAERANRVLRYGLRLFGDVALPIVPSALARMSLSFEATGISSYLWIAGKLVANFGDDEDNRIRTGQKDLYERATAKVYSLLQEKSARDIPDVIEDYLQLLLQLVKFAPDVFFESAALPVAFRVAIAALSLIHSDIIFCSLDLIRAVVTHDALDPADSAPPPKFPIYANSIRQTIDAEGLQLTGHLIAGIVGDFPEESVSTVVTIFRMLAVLWSEELLVWLPEVLNQLPTAASFAPMKQQLLTDVTTAITNGQAEKVRHAVIAFHRASSKARERRRVAPVDQ